MTTPLSNLVGSGYGEPVTILADQGEVALVEYIRAGLPYRVYLPMVLLEHTADGVYGSLENLNRGMPYGEPWETLPIGNVGAETIAGELRRRGIWTAQDLRANLQHARAALQSAYLRDYQILLDRLRGDTQSIAEEG